MPPAGSSDDLPVTLAPRAASDSKSRRTGYLALAASGLITATAFAGIADLASSTLPSASPNATRIQEFERAPHSPQAGPALVPGEAYPEHGEISVSGAAVAETFRPKDPSDPTLVVFTHPDGTTTTTVVPPPGPGTTSTPTGRTTPGSTTTTETTTTTTNETTTEETTTTETTTTTDETTTTTSSSEQESSPTTTTSSPDGPGTSAGGEGTTDDGTSPSPSG